MPACGVHHVDGEWCASGLTASCHVNLIRMCGETYLYVSICMCGGPAFKPRLNLETQMRPWNRASLHEATEIYTNAFPLVEAQKPP